MAARVHAEGLSRRLCQGWHLHTCLVLPCYGTVDIKVGSSRLSLCSQRCCVGGGMATRAHAEGHGRKPCQG
jgi:hypothetical protein